jgi:hypothetical protein
MSTQNQAFLAAAQKAVVAVKAIKSSFRKGSGPEKSLTQLESILAGTGLSDAQVAEAVKHVVSVYRALDPILQPGKEAEDLLFHVADLAIAADSSIVPPSYPPGPERSLLKASPETLAMLENLQRRL